MAIRTADVVAPMLAATEVVVFFLSRVAAKTRFRDFFRWFVFERNDLCGIAIFNVGLAGAVTGFTARHFIFPTLNVCQFGVRGVRESLELVFVTIFTSLAAYVIRSVENWTTQYFRFGGLR